MKQENVVQRNVYMVLSPHSWSYGRHAVQTLLRNSLEAIALSLLTDSTEDREFLELEMQRMEMPSGHTWIVYAEADLLAREEAAWSHLPHLRAFRHGHPCWRKVTDPLLLAEDGAEIVLLDPDLYFPNPFKFEQTPESGVLLMWQRPSCLLPPETVLNAMNHNIPLAHHVDIGVANWRGGRDVEWLNWLLGVLGGGKPLPRYAHVEAITWAALAMREGGGHLDPKFWHCWHRTQLNRVKVKLGVAGVKILSDEPWRTVKCFHGAGEAKHWLAEVIERDLAPGGAPLTAPGTIIPFVPLLRGSYDREQSFKRALGKLGYYKLFGTA